MGETYAGKSLFASTFTYGYTKLRGPEWVVAALKRGEGFPAAETFAQLRAATEGPITLFQNGSTKIGQARSFAAGEFLRCGSDVWVTFDDDHYAPAATLHAMIEAARATRALVAAPALTRNGSSLNFRRHAGEWDLRNVLTLDPVARVYPVHGIGLSCAAIHRDVIQSLSQWPGAWCHDGEEGKVYPALFLDGVFQGNWVSEDIAFCMLMHQSLLPRYVLLEHESTHAGAACKIDGHGELATDPATAKRLQSAAAS